MADISDLGRISKKIEKLISENNTNSGNVMDILKSLQSTPMTIDILQKTKIGLVVNNLRRASSDAEVNSLSKSLIKSWKKLLPQDSANGEDESRVDKVADKIESKMQSEKPLLSEGSGKRPFVLSSCSTSDPTRLKCRELLLKAVQNGSEVEFGPSQENLVSELEECIFNEFGGTDKKYMNRVRSRISNLRDSKNSLRDCFMNGEVLPAALAKMTAEEMASPQMQAQRVKLSREAIDDHQMALTGGATSSLLSCRKCGKKTVMYNQVQKRSADEPMTTNCFCSTCGHRWSFN